MANEQSAREERWRKQMQAAQAGDRRAYYGLLEEMLPLLRRYVAKNWRDANSGEDVVQDILLSMHTARHTYDPDRPFVPWLLAIARRRMIDAGRRSSRRGRHETTVDVFPETFPADDAKSGQDVSDDRADIDYALARLSPSQRQAVELTKLQGRSLEEASQLAGRSVTSLKVAVHRALKDMRRVLQERSD